MTPTDLLAKLEEAECGSPALNEEVARAFGRTIIYLGNGEDGRRIYHTPDYTRSVDAALSLVPEGHYLDLHDWTWAKDNPCWCASLQSLVGERIHASEKGRTAPLAICSAALRARAVMGGGAG